VTPPHQEPSGRLGLRIVLDTNIYISAALSPQSTFRQFLDRARNGAVELITSEKLLDELHTRLLREKFRQWLTLDEVDAFVAIVRLLSTEVSDRPDEDVLQVCADPDDNFLVALYQDSDSSILVSGDRQVQQIEYPNVHIYGPADALAALDYRHEWGAGFVLGDESAVWRQVQAEGADKILHTYATFTALIEREDVATYLPLVVVPETVPYFLRDLQRVRELVSNRSMATRPIYAAPDIAYLKLPPDSGELIRAVGSSRLPADTIFATMQRCPDLLDSEPADFGQWRVFGIGQQCPPEQMRPRAPRRQA